MNPHELEKTMDDYNGSQHLQQHSDIHGFMQKIASVSCHDIHLQMDVPKILGVLSLGLQVSFCPSCRLHRWYPVASNPRATST